MIINTLLHAYRKGEARERLDGYQLSRPLARGHLTSGISGACASGP